MAHESVYIVGCALVAIAVFYSAWRQDNPSASTRGTIVVDGDSAIVKGGIGCIDRSTYDKAMEFVHQLDQAVFGKYVVSRVAARQCISFEEGTKVIVTDVAVRDDPAQIRERGNPHSYWVPRVMSVGAVAKYVRCRSSLVSTWPVVFQGLLHAVSR